MALSIAAAQRNAMVDVITAALNGGSGTSGATLAIRSGSRPANVAAALTGTLLGTVTCSSTCAPAASAGSTTFGTITQDDSADASGTASWGRAYNKAGVAVFDFNVGLAGSGAEMILSNTTISATGPISVQTMTLTDGNP
jgi:hypothetical protein